MHYQTHTNKGTSPDGCISQSRLVMSSCLPMTRKLSSSGAGSVRIRSESGAMRSCAPYRSAFGILDRWTLPPAAIAPCDYKWPSAVPNCEIVVPEVCDVPQQLFFDFSHFESCKPEHVILVLRKLSSWHLQ